MIQYDLLNLNSLRLQQSVTFFNNVNFVVSAILIKCLSINFHISGDGILLKSVEKLYDISSISMENL